jgi:hypothetical protein
MGEVDRGAGETGVASGELLDAARHLSADGARLKQEVERFVATVRAA